MKCAQVSPRVGEFPGDPRNRPRKKRARLNPRRRAKDRSYYTPTSPGPGKNLGIVSPHVEDTLHRDVHDQVLRVISLSEGVNPTECGHKPSNECAATGFCRSIVCTMLEGVYRSVESAPPAGNTKEGDHAVKGSAPLAFQNEESTCPSTFGTDVGHRMPLRGSPADEGIRYCPHPKTSDHDAYISEQDNTEEMSPAMVKPCHSRYIVEAVVGQDSRCEGIGFPGDHVLQTVHGIPQGNIRPPSDNVFDQTGRLRTDEESGKQFGGNSNRHFSPGCGLSQMVFGGPFARRGRNSETSHRVASPSYNPVNLVESLYPDWNDLTVVDPTRSMLDPVEVAGSLRIEYLAALPKHPASPLGCTLDFLWNDAAVKNYVVGGVSPRFLRSHQSNQRFVSTMLKSGLVRLSSRSDHVCAFARFFTVVKKVDETGVPWMRTILDCQGANTIFKDAPPVNLPSLLDMLGQFDRAEEMRTLDFRHWFHQIRISKTLQRYFGVVIGNARLIWLLLAMGFKWAPFSAQSCSWFLVAGEESLWWKELPRFFQIGNCMFAIIYDNIIGGGPANELAARWAQITDRCATFGAVIKEESCSRDRGFIDAVGLRWYPNSIDGLRWTLLEKFSTKLGLWQTKLCAEKLRVKELAACVGICVWGLWATLQPLFELKKAYDVLTATVRSVGWRGSAESKGLRELLAPVIAKLLSGGIYCFPHLKTSVKIYSDASLLGFGAVREDGKFVNGRWSKVFTHRDIFYLEGIAAKLAVIRLAPESTTVILAVDNEGLYHAIRKKSSTCPRTSKVLQELFSFVASVGGVIQVVWIPTSRNPADRPSRGLSVDKTCLALAPQFIRYGRSFDTIAP